MARGCTPTSLMSWYVDKCTANVSYKIAQKSHPPPAQPWELRAGIEDFRNLDSTYDTSKYVQSRAHCDERQDCTCPRMSTGDTPRTAGADAAPLADTPTASANGVAADDAATLPMSPPPPNTLTQGGRLRLQGCGVAAGCDAAAAWPLPPAERCPADSDGAAPRLLEPSAAPSPGCPAALPGAAAAEELEASLDGTPEGREAGAARGFVVGLGLGLGQNGMVPGV